MTVLLSVTNHINRLVHPDMRACELENARHRVFITTRIGLFLAAMTSAPLFLASGHVPAMWQAVALAWLMVPLASVAYVSRTGRLIVGEAACLSTWAGIAVTAAVGGGVSLGGAWALLLLIPLEASCLTEAKLVTRGLAVAVSIAFALWAAAIFGLLPNLATGLASADAALIGPALAYSIALAMSGSVLQRMYQRFQALGEQRYRVLSEAIGDLLLRYDRAGGVLFASREAEQLFGIKPRDLLGRGFFERVHVGDRPAFLKLFGDAAASEATVAATLRFRISTVDGEEDRPTAPVFAWIEVRARRFHETGLAITKSDSAIVAIVRDITAQRRHEQAIREARDEAERANAWKDGFLANVSHELRTPLNAIIGFSEILSNPELNPRDPAKQREYAGIITSSGHHLLSVVNSLLDISKIEAGCFEISPEPFDMNALVLSCCDMVGLKAEQAGVEIARAPAVALDDIVADQRACRQIVINLLSNALKFTPRGGQVAVWVKPQGNSVVITLEDTGIGIAARDLARLGDAFFQAKAGYDRSHEGTGLGLSVVRGLVGLHGGNIGIESAPGEGTRVSVRLPLDCRKAGLNGAAAKIDILHRPAKSKAFPPINATKVQKIA